MHCTGKKIYATPAEMMECKNSEMKLAEFIRLAKGWINGYAFKCAYSSKATPEEWKVWLTTGIWEAFRYLDDRVTATPAILLELAWRLAMNSHKAAYLRPVIKGTPKKSKELSTVDEYGKETIRDKNGNEIIPVRMSSATKGEDGELNEILIPVSDTGLASIDFNDFMESMKLKLSEIDFYILEKKLQGDTLEEIGLDLNITRQAVDNRFKRFKHLLNAFVR